MGRIILLQNLLLQLPEEVLVAAVQTIDVLNAFGLSKKALEAAVVKPGIRYTVWRYEIEGLAPSPNLCFNCDDHQNDVFELVDPDDLLDMFPFGEWLDDDTFSVNLHPNCHCLVVRDQDVYW